MQQVEISASSQYAGTIETLNDELKESIAEVLCMDSQEVDIDDTFIDIGMDSITGLEWIKAINKQYGTSFSVTKVYDYPTIRQFANMLKAELVNHSNRSKERADELFQENKQPEAPAKAKPAERSIQPVRPPAMKAPEQKPDRPHQGYRDDAIAIVGMAGRYPGAKDVREYWDHLVNARNAIRDIPKSRWDVDKYYDPALNQKGKVYCKSLGMLDDIEHFDPLFFNIPPSEAELIDP